MSEALDPATGAAMPSIGRIVHVRFYKESFNNSIDHPAIVTAAHGPYLINCKVLVDGPDAPIWLTSIERRDQYEAREKIKDPSGKIWEPRATWVWPPRV